MYTLKKKNNIVEIFNKGQFEEFKEEVVKQSELYKKYSELHEHFIRYFPEVFHTNLEMNEEKPLDRKYLFKDSKLQEFIDLSNRFYSTAFYWGNYNRVSKLIPLNYSQEEISFYKNYINLKKPSEITVSLSECIEKGYVEIIEYLLYQHPYYKRHLIERICSRFMLIKDKLKLSEKELANKIGYSEEEISQFEHGKNISAEVLYSYASLGIYSLSEILGE